MRERRAVLERRRQVDDGVERLVLDLDELGRVLRLRARLGKHDRNAVALVPGDVRQRVVRWVSHVLRDRPGAGHGRLPVLREVGRREDGDDAFRLAGGGDVHAGDVRVGVGAADDDHVRPCQPAPCCRRTSRGR